MTTYKVMAIPTAFMQCFSQINMKTKLSIVTALVATLITGCASEEGRVASSAFSPAADGLKIMPIPRASITGYSERMTAYPASILNPIVQVQSGEYTMISPIPTCKQMSILYEGTRYPLCVRGGQYKVEGMFDWSYSNLMKGEGQQFYGLKLIPIEERPVLPGVSQIALIGVFDSRKPESLKQAKVLDKFYAVQLNKDRQWHVIVDHELQDVMPKNFFRFDISNIETQVIDIRGKQGVPETHEEFMAQLRHGYTHWQAIYSGTNNGVIEFQCEKSITTHAGMFVSPLANNIVQQVNACGKTILIDELQPNGVMQYRISLN